MDLAARPHITAGVALASAAILATGPITQHAPDLPVAQYLSQVSVSHINLTDAGSVLDLFSGVESELASLASGASVAAVPASVVNPIPAWVDTFTRAAGNLEAVGNTWLSMPTPVLRQVLANGVQYTSEYVGNYQEAAMEAINYFFASPGTKSEFPWLLNQALSEYLAGNITTAGTRLYQAVFADPLLLLAPLEKNLLLPANAIQNLANAYTYLAGTGLQIVAEYLTTGPVYSAEQAISTGFQAASQAYGSGDLLGAVTNLLNIPGVTADYVLNGVTATNAGGLISGPVALYPYASGLLNSLINTIPRAVAGTIVAPGAQPITGGGSLASALQGFTNQLVNGWPSLTPVINSVGGQLTALLQNIPSLVSNLPSIVSNAAATMTGSIGFFIASLLRLL
ncbi:hypothetical protein [Mycobacterium malmoense]|uniref:hypothetical protein n=1 Tax=Mycobacterium malmoense TaxID=1780 RepID=UPI00114D4DD3|nr:hypothetical protein [Mycobacterium malmoense]